MVALLQGAPELSSAGFAAPAVDVKMPSATADVALPEVDVDATRPTADAPVDVPAVDVDAPAVDKSSSRLKGKLGKMFSRRKKKGDSVDADAFTTLPGVSGMLEGASGALAGPSQLPDMSDA